MGAAILFSITREVYLTVSNMLFVLMTPRRMVEGVWGPIIERGLLLSCLL